MPDRDFELPPTSDGQLPTVHVWDAASKAKACVVIAHGMGEHSLRYAPLAESLNRSGFDVFAHDHRGHGRTAGDPARLGEFGPEGWRGLIDDQLRVIERARELSGLPVLLLGHSMGSMVVQHLITEASASIEAAALSGTTAVDLMAAASDTADDEASSDFDLFATFNAAFEPVRTESDWLSRDPEQVDLYLADPLCGFGLDPASMTSMMQAGVEYSSPRATRQIRKDLPLYLFAGDRDPVGGGGKFVTVVAERYRTAGIEDVTLRLYPEARHEVLNETNRREVEDDFTAWATRVMDARSTRRQ